MKHITQQFIIPSGTKSGEPFTVNLKEYSTIFGIALFVNGTLPIENINFTIKDSDLTTVLEPTHFQELLYSSGNTFKDRLRPVNIKGKTITVEINSKVALADDFSGQIQFYKATELTHSQSELEVLKSTDTCLIN